MEENMSSGIITNISLLIGSGIIANISLLLYSGIVAEIYDYHVIDPRDIKLRHSSI